MTPFSPPSIIIPYYFMNGICYGSVYILDIMVSHIYTQYRSSLLFHGDVLHIKWSTILVICGSNVIFYSNSCCSSSCYQKLTLYLFI